MNELLNKLDGLMLSDGCIFKDQKSKNYRYEQECIYREWLEYIKDYMSINGIQSSIYTIKRIKPGWGTSKLYRLLSLSLPFFTEQRHRWYESFYYENKDGYECFKYKKAVPKDIELTPECVANWFMGDGCFDKTYMRIQIATDDFKKSDVDYLVFLLEDQIIEHAYAHHHYNGKYIIKIGKRSDVTSFLDYVRPYIVQCYNYKIPEVKL